METKIQKLPPDLLEVELAKFLKGAREYLFEKKKNMVDLLIIGAWLMLGVAILIRIGG